MALEPPKRPLTGYMIFLGENREQIKRDNPGISVMEVARRGSEIWHSLEDKTIWIQKANAAKERYFQLVKIYENNGGKMQGKYFGKKHIQQIKHINRPKRPLSGYFLWLNENREQIKRAHPGIKVTEVARLGGEIWRTLKDKSKWVQQANEARERYTELMKVYQADAGKKQVNNFQQNAQQTPQQQAPQQQAPQQAPQQISQQNSRPNTQQHINHGNVWQHASSQFLTL